MNLPQIEQVMRCHAAYYRKWKKWNKILQKRTIFYSLKILQGIKIRKKCFYYYWNISSPEHRTQIDYNDNEWWKMYRCFSAWMNRWICRVNFIITTIHGSSWQRTSGECMFGSINLIQYYISYENVYHVSHVSLCYMYILHIL